MGVCYSELRNTAQGYTTCENLGVRNALTVRKAVTLHLGLNSHKAKTYTSLQSHILRRRGSYPVLVLEADWKLYNIEKKLLLTVLSIKSIAIRTNGLTSLAVKQQPLATQHYLDN